MRTYFNLPPGCTPADIECHTGGDEDYDEIHAMGWKAFERGNPLESNPYPEEKGTMFAPSMYERWAWGWQAAKEMGEVIK